MDNQNSKETPRTQTSSDISAKIKSNKTPLLIIALALLTGILLLVALAPKNKVSNPTNTSQNPAPSAPAEAVLSFGNSTSSGSIDNVDVIADTGKATTTAVQLEMSFDPKLISNVTVSPGDLVKGWDVLINKVDYNNGRISFAIGMPLSGTGVKGQGVVARLSFTESGARGQTINITMLPKTLVSIQGFAGSSLKSTSNFTKVIGETPAAVPSATTSGQ